MLFLTCLLVSCFLHAAAAVSFRKSYANYSLLSVTCDTIDQARFLEMVQSQEIETGTFGVEIWQPPVLGSPIDVLVSPKCLQELLRDLERTGITYEVKVDNIEKVLEIETPSDKVRDAPEKYLTLQEVEDFLIESAFKYPNLVKLETIGTSHENRSIIVAKISGNASNKKRVIWIDAGIHAREWIAPATSLHIISKLLTEKPMMKYLEKFEWHFLPVVNPDGYHYSHTVDRMWRKNRRRGPCRCFAWVKHCCDGVDLNRNFGYEFGGAGSSKYPCDNTYRGPSAFSEPESAAVRDYLLRIANITILYIALHSYGQLWVYPFSDRLNSYPDDYKELDTLAKNATKALEKVYGSKYRVGTAADIMYATTGSAADWAKSVAKIKYVYGIELRPANEKRRASGFIVPPHEIGQSGDEIWAAVSTLVDAIA